MIKTRIFAIFLMAFFLFGMSAFANTKLEECEIKTNAHCGDCKSKIEKALKKQGGVMSTNLNLENKIVAVKYDPNKTNTNKLISAITNAGYTAELINSGEASLQGTSTETKSVEEDSKSEVNSKSGDCKSGVKGKSGDCCKSGVKAKTDDCCKSKKK